MDLLLKINHANRIQRQVPVLNSITVSWAIRREQQNSEYPNDGYPLHCLQVSSAARSLSKFELRFAKSKSTETSGTFSPLIPTNPC
jgi:hypothetical protein